MNVTFRRVLGRRATSPVVIATADDYRVHWTPAKGWTCDCDEHEHPDCPHIPAVAALLDPRVINGDHARITVL